MAKRRRKKKKKKLNKSVVIVLLILCLTVLGSAGYVMGVKYPHIFFPKDVAKLNALAEEKMAEKKYQEAGEIYHEAMLNADKGMGRAKGYMKLAEYYLKRYFEDKSLNDAAKKQQLGGFISSLDTASQKAPDWGDPAKRRFNAYIDELTPRVIPSSMITDAATTLLNHDPDNHKALFWLGYFKGAEARRSQRTDELNAAIGHLRKAAELDPENSSYWIEWLALKIYSEKTTGDETAGERAFKESLAKRKSARICVEFAGYLQARNKEPEALEQIKAAIEAEPKEYYGHLAMAHWQIKHDKLDEALKAFETALKVAPGEPVLYYQKAIALQIAGKGDESFAVLQEGVKNVAKHSKEKKHSFMDEARIAREMQFLHYQLGTAFLRRAGTTPEGIKAAQEQYDDMTRLRKQGYGAFWPYWDLAARIASVEGRIADAIDLWRDAMNRGAANNAGVNSSLAIHYLKVGRLGEADRTLEVFRSRPGMARNIRFMDLHARIKIQARDFASARRLVSALKDSGSEGQKYAAELTTMIEALSGEEITDLTKLSSATVALRLVRAQALWDSGRRVAAREMVEQLYKAKPEDKDIALAMYSVYSNLRLHDKAKDALKAATKANPKDEDLKFAALIAGKSKEEVLKMRLERVKDVEDPYTKAMQKAEIYRRVPDAAESKRWLDEAIKIKPDSPEALQRRYDVAAREMDWDFAKGIAKRMQDVDESQGKLLQANIHLAKKENEAALSILRPLVKSDPNSKHVYRLLGRAYQAEGDMDKAAAAFKEVMKLDPRDVDTIVRLAKLAASEGDKEEHSRLVMDAYKSGVGMHDAYIEAEYLRMDEAQADDREILVIIAKREDIRKANPSNIRNLLSLARLYEDRLNRKGKAEEVYRLAYTESNKSMGAVAELARFYVRLNRPAEAGSMIQRGIEASRTSSEKVKWLVIFGDHLDSLGSARAENAYKMAVAADSKDALGYSALAQYLGRQQKWSKAAEAMKSSLAIKDDDRVRNTRITYLLNAREFGPARKAIATLLAKRPDDKELKLLQAQSSMMEGNVDNALDMLNRIVEERPKYVMGWIYKARVYLNKGEVQKAKNDLKVASTLSKAPSVLLSLAKVYLQLGYTENEEATLIDIIKRSPRFEPAGEQLVMLYLRPDQFTRTTSAKAKKYLATARKQFPRSVWPLTLEARRLGLHGDQNGVADFFAKAAQLVPNNEQIARRHVAYLIVAKRNEEAAKVAAGYSANAPWKVWADAMRARALLRSGQTAAGEKLFEQTLKGVGEKQLKTVVEQIRIAYGSDKAAQRLYGWLNLRPNDWQMNMYLGDAYVASSASRELTDTQRSKAIGSSIAAYKKAVSLAKAPADQAAAYGRLGMVYGMVNNYQEVEKSYLESIRLSPDAWVARNNIAYLYVDILNKPKKALEHAKKAYELKPLDANVLDTYGWALAKAKQYEQAESILQQSIEQDLSQAPNRFHLGWVFEKTRRLTLAKKQYRRGLDLVDAKQDAQLHKDMTEALKRVETP